MATAKGGRSKYSVPKEITDYSKKIYGDPKNYNQAVRFDDTDGYIGITQYDGDSVRDRVLLSPRQLKALMSFAEAKA